MPSHIPPFAIVGSTGMLGRAWCELLDARGQTHHDLHRGGTGVHHIDLANPATLTNLREGTQLVINAAGYTNVDACETDEAAATQINGTGVGQLAARCREIGATLIHYSTDYVFAGEATSPYPVDAPRNPVSAYGRSKALGEELLLASGCDHRLIRTSWLYAPWGKNFVLTMLKLIADKSSLKVVHDQRGRPTSAQALAAASLTLAEQAPSGVYHVADAGECTWYEFTGEILRLSGKECTLTPCTTAEFPRPAKRPAYSVLDLSQTEHYTGPLNDWKNNLTETVQRI